MKKPLLILLIGIFVAVVDSIAQPILTATGINPVVGDQNTINK